MAGILNRTIFVDDSKGYVLWHDWAKVTTGIGAMVEPRCFFAQRPMDGTTSTGSRIEKDDDIWRVDSIDRIAIGKEKMFLSDEKDMALHGGELWPRIGY